MCWRCPDRRADSWSLQTEFPYGEDEGKLFAPILDVTRGPWPKHRLMSIAFEKTQAWDSLLLLRGAPEPRLLSLPKRCLLHVWG